MTEHTTSRRTVLKGIGSALAATGPGAIVTGAVAGAPDRRTVGTPVGGTLYDVERTAAGVYTVGAGGTVVER